LGSFLPFQTASDQDHHRKRQALLGENSNLRFDLIVQYLELFLTKADDQISSSILHHDGKNDQVGVDADRRQGVTHLLALLRWP